MTDEIRETLESVDRQLQTIEADELDPDQYHVLRDVVARIHVLHDSVAFSEDDVDRDMPPIGSRIATDGGDREL